MLEYLGPREERSVTIDGFVVPRVEARESEDGLTCSISLDGRFGIIVPAEAADRIIWMIANAMAIGAGYSCHGANSQPINPYRVQVLEIASVRGSAPDVNGAT